ncbi:apoptosis regulatory protein Siva [Daphnia magna]|uniref:Apoptosis regulatory protein Siva n=1 Tax=Daphnia magna TaxID=35525 RepID=A0ABR0B3D4_9CRUS|nr:apoptosis regulatory protein Siva [Daphnia magna]KAK4036211.1 hypothetical protein OUZ56_028278 [Daphnia magna]
MPKRSISELDWGDSLSHCPQSKIQVGNREINQGICAASNMKAVYSRTLNLLFQGSKAKANPTEMPPPTASTASLTATSLPKYSQTILTPDGQILPQTERNLAVSLPFANLACTCMSCSSASSGLLERCQFCEGTFCDKCFRLCMSCTGEYCSKCSIQTYSRDECTICLSCATERGHL